MKKIILLLVTVIILLTTSSCLKRDDLEGITVYTTVYPVEFLTYSLYGYNSDVYSIYPDGVNVNDYKLTSKQITDYSKAEIFVYNGLTDEKQIAKDFINKNKKLRIVDVSYGLKYTYGVEELWLSPNNYLMLASTIKNNFQDFIDNKFIKEEIENNYINKLEDSLSLMDAELRSIAKVNANGNNNPIIASGDVFKFLINYGFDVISLEDETTLSMAGIATLKSNFKSGKYTHLFVRNDEEHSDLIKELIENNAEILTFHMLSNLSDEERNTSETYFTIMGRNIDLIKTATIGK